MRGDQSELDKKRSKANHHLKEMCNKNNIFLIDHSKKDQSKSFE